MSITVHEIVMEETSTETFEMDSPPAGALCNQVLGK